MDRVFESGAVVVPPSAPVSPSTGYPTNGNPIGGVPATKPGEYWFHMITEELRAVIAAAALTPAHGTLNQLLQALPAALASRPEMARSIVANGYQKLPGGLILQWGTFTGSSVAFPMTFPTAARQVMTQMNSNGGTTPTDTTFYITSLTTSGFNWGSSTGGRFFAIGH